MAFRFRRSKKVGPFRLSVSRRSLSTSVGVPGFRKTWNSKGRKTTTVNVPGTGMSWVNTSNSKKGTPQMSLPPPPPPGAGQPPVNDPKVWAPQARDSRPPIRKKLGRGKKIAIGVGAVAVIGSAASALGGKDDGDTKVVTTEPVVVTSVAPLVATTPTTVKATTTAAPPTTVAPATTVKATVATTTPALPTTVATTRPTTTRPTPTTAAPVATEPPAPTVYYANCTEAKNAGAAPINRGEPGYRSALDRDGDGIACDK